MEKIFTGFKPTGHLQLGNYLGVLKQLSTLADDPGKDVTVCVADMHALTVRHDPVKLRVLTREMVTIFLALGLGDKAKVFVQSSIPAHSGLHYLLESTAVFGEMKRMIQFKEKSANETSVRLSLLTYPALMAADILAHQTDLVPVGEDQLQHLQLTVSLAERFNKTYGRTFTTPKALHAQVAKVKDLRDPTAKMGKSNSDSQGVIFLLDSPDVINAKMRKAVTDNDPEIYYDPVNRESVSNLLNILAALENKTPQKVAEGIRGAGKLKEALTASLVEHLTPLQTRFKALEFEDGLIGSALKTGADQAAGTAEMTLRNAKEAMGLLQI